MADTENSRLGVPEPGRCVFCGCTELTPCEGGCSWVNEERTVCSSCEQAPEISAMAVGAALAQLQVAIYAFEDTCGNLAILAGYLVDGDFDAVFGDVARLYGNVARGVRSLLEQFPEAQREIPPDHHEGEQDPPAGRIIVP